jgi:hypothetical protein
MITQDDKYKFRAWLKQNTNLSQKAIGDVVSRINRINKIIPLHANGAADDFLFNLGKNIEFLSLRQTVKSQLKRAYKLYYQFKGGK